MITPTPSDDFIAHYDSIVSYDYGFQSNKIRKDVACFECSGLGFVRTPTKSVRCTKCEVDERELPPIRMDDSYDIFIDDCTIPEFIWKRVK